MRPPLYNPILTKLIILSLESSAKNYRVTEITEKFSSLTGNFSVLFPGFSANSVTLWLIKGLHGILPVEAKILSFLPIDVKIQPMNPARKWLQDRAYAAHVAAFLMMLVAPLLMYLAARHAITAWIYPPLALFILANLLELCIP